jgi:hypothetical protein
MDGWTGHAKKLHEKRPRRPSSSFKHVYYHVDGCNIVPSCKRMENDFSSHSQPFELFLSLLHIHYKTKLGRKKKRGYSHGKL